MSFTKDDAAQALYKSAGPTSLPLIEATQNLESLINDFEKLKCPSTPPQLQKTGRFHDGYKANGESFPLANNGSPLASYSQKPAVSQLQLDESVSGPMEICKAPRKTLFAPVSSTTPWTGDMFNRSLIPNDAIKTNAGGQNSSPCFGKVSETPLDDPFANSAGNSAGTFVGVPFGNSVSSMSHTDSNKDKNNKNNKKSKDVCMTDNEESDISFEFSLVDVEPDMMEVDRPSEQFVEDSQGDIHLVNSTPRKPRAAYNRSLS
jgi:hypothetical protein